MTREQAIDILIQVAHIAQKSGALGLQDAVAVAQAITVLKPLEEKKEGSAEKTK